MLCLFVTSRSFSLFHLIHTNDRADRARSICGLETHYPDLWRTRVLTCAPASGSEAGCRNPEAPTIFHSFFKAQFQYSPIFSSFSQRAIQSPGKENVFSSPILTSASSSCTFESLVLCDGLHLSQRCRGLFKY